MNHQQYKNKEFCYYHPKQGLNGVCPFCLNEKLLIVETNQTHLRRLQLRRHEDSGKKMFGFGSLFNRRRRRLSYGCDDDASDDHTISTSTTFEDSFISIKFEENGIALWDNSKVPKDECSNKNEHVGLTKEAGWRSSSNKSVVEHAKSSTRVSLRWRKRIGHLLNLVKLNRFRKVTQRR